MKAHQFPLAILLILTTSNFIKAQDTELGLFLGTSHYQGDLAESRITLSETKPSFGGFFRYYFNPHFNFKGGIYYGWISGSDENYDQRWRNKRNLSFRTHILEGTAQVEYNILPYVSNSVNNKWAPYVFTGVSLFHFNPKTDFENQTVKLQPLGTEGQGKPGNPDKYSRLQLSIPFGVGIKYSIGNRWNLGLEVGVRKTFTDYLDDVSTEYADLEGLAADVADNSENSDRFDKQAFQAGDGRGNPEADDWYTFVGLTISKTFRSGNDCTDFY